MRASTNLVDNVDAHRPRCECVVEIVVHRVQHNLQAQSVHTHRGRTHRNAQASVVDKLASSISPRAHGFVLHKLDVAANGPFVLRVRLHNVNQEEVRAVCVAVEEGIEVGDSLQTNTCSEGLRHT